MIGNVALDRTADHRWTPGGPSLYTAHALLALGANVTLITALTPDYPPEPLAHPRLDVRGVPTATTCRYANTYDAGGNRTQLLLCAGPPLAVADVPACDALMVAPAYHELAASPGSSAPIHGIALQGLLRTRTAAHEVHPRPDPLPHVREYVDGRTIAFFGDEDTADPVALARALASLALAVCVTHGQAGATLYVGSSERHEEAMPAWLVDPTGAGDCFAAAFLLRFAETSDLKAAFSFALAAGALSVESSGWTGVPARAAVEARLREATA